VAHSLALITVDIATTFNVLPEKVDLLSLVLTLSGVGALAGTFVGIARGLKSEHRSRCVERCALSGAGLAVVVFTLLYMHQELL
jgi:hypothetical protein